MRSKNMDELLPKHIAIIMDGNRRWAKQRNLPVKLGHKEGAETLKKVVRYANKRGIEYITVYAFSTENWKREKDEVDSLMSLLEYYLDQFSKEADSENIVIKVIGRRNELSEKLLKKIDEVVAGTKNNTGIVFTIALNYGGRDEIVNAIKNLVEDTQNNKIDVDDINEELISNYLYTKNMPDPDLMIRTSGELRTSNFLPWQLVYSEFLFLDKLWPDFSEKDLEDAIKVFSKRNRKFGAK
ncbi:MAG: isoprenyl transferase [Clostridia bacterium]|nr:isoprenyl transferase [Clostridia bacterium]